MKKNRQDEDLDDLMDSISRRFKTTMIGALAKFEESFGYLWQEDSKNADEYFELWQETRNNILNNGNNQLRSALDELNEYAYNKEKGYKYHYQFYFKNNRQDKGDNL
jgi:hypothetical protein